MRGLFSHPAYPVLFLHNMTKYAVSEEFTRIVNDIMSLMSPITWGIRHIYTPQVLGVPKHINWPCTFISLFRLKLDIYNKLIVDELKKGKY